MRYAFQISVSLLFLIVSNTAVAQEEVREVEVPVVIDKPNCNGGQQPELNVLNNTPGGVQYVLRSRADADHWFLGAERSNAMSIAQWDAPVPPARILVSCGEQAVTALDTHSATAP